MSKLRMLAIAAVTALSTLTVTPLPAAALTADEATSIRTTFTLAAAAVHDMLAGVTDYSVARAGNNDYGMRRAAASMLGSMAEARIWLALLDAQVTTDGFSAETDQAVTDLRTLLATTFDALDDAFFSNDLSAINAGLDQSSGRLNRLLLDMTTVGSAIVAKVGTGQ